MANRKDTTIFKNEHVSVEGYVACVEVGRTRKLFFVHDKLLAKRSTFFKQELEAASATNRPMHVPDVKVATFELYVQYIYGGSLPCKKLDPTSSDFEPLVNLYLAAQRFKDTPAMDAVISAMLVLYDRALPLATTIRKVYESTTPVPQLRRLFVDMFLWQEDPDMLSDALESHLEFLADLSKAALLQLQAKSDGKGVVTYQNTDCCDYHEHDDGAECNNRKRKRDDSDGEVSEASGDEESEADSVNPAHTVKKLQKQIKVMQDSLAASVAS